MLASPAATPTRRVPTEARPVASKLSNVIDLTGSSDSDSDNSVRLYDFTLADLDIGV